MRFIKNRILLIVLTASIAFSVCSCKSEKVTEIQKEQAKIEEPTTHTDLIFNNMKKNSKSAIEKAAKVDENNTYKTDDKTAVEMIDSTTRSFTDILDYIMFTFFEIFERILIPLCLFITMFGLFMAYMYKLNKPKFKWYLALAVAGPILFLFVTYGPAFYWYIIK